MAHEQTIADLAYALWQARGSPHGSAEIDWMEAQRQVLASRKTPVRPADATDEALRESFPASDPPASHIPDRPPSNAGDKWATAESAGGKTGNVQQPANKPIRKKQLQ